MTGPAPDVVAEAERVLERAPAYVWDGETLPVPVEDLVDSVFGLLVREVWDMGAAPGVPPLADGQALSGLLLPARGEIWVNAEEAQRWPPRRRFTIAHELGHWQMHRQDGQQSLFCRRTTVDDEGAAAGGGDVPARTVPAGAARDIEEEASRFAAELLMPSWLFIREHAACGGDVEELCRRFASSRKATERRIERLFGAPEDLSPR